MLLCSSNIIKSLITIKLLIIFRIKIILILENSRKLSENIEKLGSVLFLIPFLPIKPAYFQRFTIENDEKTLKWF